MDEPILKLTVEKGPKEGETLTCTRKSKIRIGRVVKGNTFTIKDSGISSKHLSIEFKDGSWLLTDLDSSNGTILNDTHLQGMKGYELKNGDIIKIGELTSLKILLEEEEENQQQEEAKPVKTGSKKIAKKGCVEVGEEVEQKRRYPARNTRAATKGKGLEEGEKAKEELESVAVNRPRRGVRAKKVVSENVSEKGDLEVESFGGPRRGVRAKKVVLENVSEKGDLEVESFGGPRRGVRAKKVVSENVSEKGDLEVESFGGQEEEKASPVAVNRPRRGAKANAKAKKVEVINEKESKETEKLVEKSGKYSDLEVPMVAWMLSPGKEVADDMVNENVKTNDGSKVGSEIDLEKMTLGEWFDYLEVYLPKQINETADEVISSMRERAKKFNEFVLQQQDLKGKSPMS